MEDILSRPRALKTLVELSKREPMTMRQFMEASGYFWEAANLLREEMETAGLIHVKSRLQGRVSHKEIWLTEESREIAEICHKIVRLAESAKRRANNSTEIR